MSLTEADFMLALHGFISSVTGLDATRIFRGNQSRMVLPKKGAYCIYTPIIRQRRGTNVYSFDAVGKPDDKNGVDSISTLVLVNVQVDFYADNAAQNAQALEIASRSYIGTDYFKQLETPVNVRVCTAENPRNLTGIDQSDQYEERWSVMITTEINAGITHELPWFEDVHFRRKLPDGTYTDGFVNVDTEFPPTE